MANANDLFDAADLDDLVTGFSQSAAWQRARRCPNRDPRSGGAVQNCPVCAGIGFTWTAPVAYDLTLTSFETMREYAQVGEWEKGDALLVLPATYVVQAVRVEHPLYTQLGETDRVVSRSGGQRQTAVLLRGTNDTLPHVEPVAVIECDAVVGAARVVYVSPADFTLVGRVMTWVTARGPPTGTRYAVTYTARPEWYVYRDLVVQRQHQKKDLPRRVHLRGAEAFWRGHGGEPRLTP